MKSQPFLVPGMLTVLILSACSGAAAPQGTPPEPAADAPAPVQTPASATPDVVTVEQSPVDESSIVPRELVEQAKADLARRLDLAVDEIRLADARPADWPDASLGCPQAGMAYAAVITPGYWILLEAGERHYPYHTDTVGRVILCLGSRPAPEGDSPPMPLLPVDPTEIQDGQPWVPVN